MSIMHAATIQSRMHNMTCWIWQKSHCQRPAADTPLVLAVSPLVAQWPWGSESHDDRVETGLTLPQYTALGITTVGFQLNHKDSRMLNRRLKILTIYLYPSKYWQLATLYEYLSDNIKTRTYRHFTHIEWKVEPKNFHGLL